MGQGSEGGREAPRVEACAEFVEGVASRDVKLGELVWVRIFLPEEDGGQQGGAKPLVLYAHGGAYTKGQPDWPPFHSFCSTLSKLSRSIWISLSYRLAPAHRLPAAYDDAALALRWLLSHAHASAPSADSWLSPDLADFSNLFLAGDSAGANIMLKVAMDAASSGLLDLQPLRLRGLLLIQPGFHSEDSNLDGEIRHRYHRALPVGETLDYPPVNPIHPKAPPLTPLSAYPHIFINAAQTDPRFDMTIRFHHIIRDFCPHVELFVSPGKGHEFHLDDPHCPEAHDLHAQLASFIGSSTAS